MRDIFPECGIQPVMTDILCSLCVPSSGRTKQATNQISSDLSLTVTLRFIAA